MKILRHLTKWMKPKATDIEEAQLALNTEDRTLWSKKEGEQPFPITGDVAMVDTKEALLSTAPNKVAVGIGGMLRGLFLFNNEGVWEEVYPEARIPLTNFADPSSEDDQSEAIREWLSAGKRLFVPEGRYYFSEGLDLPEGVDILGEGELSIFKLHPDAVSNSYGMLDIHGKCTLKDFKLDGNEQRVADKSTIDYSGGIEFGSGVIHKTASDSVCDNVVSVDWVKHCFDISAETYKRADNDNTKWVEEGRPSNIVWKNCHGAGAGDDVFTTHQCDRVLIDNCVAKDPKGTYRYGNTNGFEIDDGSIGVTLIDSYASGCASGVQIKGHDNAAAAQTVYVDNVTIDGCRYGLNMFHIGSTDTSATGKNIKIGRVYIRNPLNIFPELEEDWGKPYFFKISAYNGVTVEQLDLEGGNLELPFLGRVSGYSRSIHIETISIDTLTTAEKGLEVTSSVDSVLVGTMAIRNASGVNTLASFKKDSHEVHNIEKPEGLSAVNVAIGTNKTLTHGVARKVKSWAYNVNATDGEQTRARVCERHVSIEGAGNMGKGDGLCTAYSYKPSGEAERDVVEFGSFRRSSTDGNFAYMGYIGVSPDGVGPVIPVLQVGHDVIRPWSTETVSLGSSSYRYTKVYASEGVVMKSPDGTSFLVSVADDGTLMID